MEEQKKTLFDKACMLLLIIFCALAVIMIGAGHYVSNK